MTGYCLWFSLTQCTYAVSGKVHTPVTRSHGTVYTYIGTFPRYIRMLRTLYTKTNNVKK